MNSLTWLNQGLYTARVSLVLVFTFLYRDALRPWQNHTARAERLTHKSGFNVSMLLNRYVASVLFAVLLHALLLALWYSPPKPIELSLQEGHQAVSFKLATTSQAQTKVAANPSSEQTEVRALPLAPHNADDHNVAESGPAVISSRHETLRETFSRPKRPPVDSRKVLPINTPYSLVEPNYNDVERLKSEVVVDSRAQSGNEPEPIADTKEHASDADAVENKPDDLPVIQLQDVEAKPKGVLASAQPLSNNSPKYPRRAVMRNQQGRVKVSLSVDEGGYATKVELIEGSGYTLLDNSVLRFVEQERFVPAMRNGEAVASTQLFLFRFVLE